MIKEFTLQQIKQGHKITCPDVSLEFFMEHYCKSFLDRYKSVEVIVNKEFKFTFK